MKVQSARGTYDILPTDCAHWQTIEDQIRNFCLVYGYEEIRTPIFEDTAVFKRENDSSDMVNKEMYSFSINGKDSITLRPEGTAGVIRSYVQHKLYASELPAKLMYYGPMFRYERPQKGRQRQFYQFGIENIGVKSPTADVEVIALGYSLVKSMGLSNIKVLVNTLGDDESRNNYRTCLKEYFKDVVHELCSDCQRRYQQNPLRLLDCKVDHDHPSMKNVVSMQDTLTDASKEYFNEVLSGLDALEIPYEIAPSLVRGLDYYTETVFEVVSTHEASGSQSTIFGGGRYDKLVEYFDGPQHSGVGFAMGIERLLILAKAEGIITDEGKRSDVYVITLDNVGSYPLEVATALRANGYITEMNVVKRSMKAQFKSAERYQAPFIVILGESEKNERVVNIKNTINQTQVTVPFADLIDTLDSFSEHDEHCECCKE